jgi:hypothetical protein
MEEDKNYEEAIKFYELSGTARLVGSGAEFKGVLNLNLSISSEIPKMLLKQTSNLAKYIENSSDKARINRERLDCASVLTHSLAECKTMVRTVCREPRGI